jgi:Mlc titration factor MtfA (ptsG expression regulator)
MEQNVPLYRRLPVEDREELQRHIQVFLAEKSFEGGGGLVVTDEVRVTVAAQACILLLHRTTDYYPGLSSVIVYPEEYLAPLREMDEWGIVTEGTDRRSGESCREGALVLSWEDVLAKGLDVHAGYNVVLHECAHQLDTEEGITSDTPLLGRRSGYRLREETLLREFKRLRDDAERHRPTVLDPYGAESMEEFFAVATEAFFQTPIPLRDQHTDLYGELARYYRQDPAGWPGDTADPPHGR